MNCEICGRSIVGDPVVVEVDKAVLYVCKTCGASFGKRVATPQRSPKPRVQNPRPPRRELEVVENFHLIIKRGRENLGLSREALAAMLGVKETVLRRIESGQLQPDLALARRIEKALGVKILAEVSEEGVVKDVGGLNKGLTLGDIAEVRDSEK